MEHNKKNTGEHSPVFFGYKTNGCIGLLYHPAIGQDQSVN